MAVVYSAECFNCGNELKIEEFKLDSGNDLIIKVEPCEHCLEEAYDEGKSDGEAEDK